MRGGSAPAAASASSLVTAQGQEDTCRPAGGAANDAALKALRCAPTSLANDVPAAGTPGLVSDRGTAPTGGGLSPPDLRVP